MNNPASRARKERNGIEGTAIILAGGKSSRMGSDKAALDFKGMSFLENSIRIAGDFDDIIIASRESDDYRIEGIRCVGDLFPDRGPLCALYSCISEAKYERAVVLSVDAPFLTGELLSWLYHHEKRADAVIPRIGRFYHPLCASYSKSCLPVMERALERGRGKIIDIFEDLNTVYPGEAEIRCFGDPDRLFCNINRPDEYAKYCLEGSPM